MEGNYRIILKLEEKDHIHSNEIYRLEEINTRKELIAKLYDNSRINFYQTEHDILSNLDIIYSPQEESPFFLMFKIIPNNQILFNFPQEIRNFNGHKLFYDYLPRLSLLDYLNQTKEKIKEIHAKYLCYELLHSIKKLHLINICHKTLDIDNIMFDENFNIKIIDYSEAKLISNNNEEFKMNKDLFDLGKILAKIISLGKFESIVFNKKENCYKIYSRIQSNSFEESEFWNTVNINGIYVPENFLKFFKILINSKITKELVDIDTLLKDEWLEEVINDIEKYRNIFKDDFKVLYKTIIDDNEKMNKVDTEYGKLVEESEDEIFVEDTEVFKPEFGNCIYEKNILNDIGKLNIIDGNVFKPRKDQFNYLKVNIENKKERDIKDAIKSFIGDFEKKIKKKYEEENKGKKINVNFCEEKETSFKIKFDIAPILVENDEILFLDEKFEKKIKNKQEFEIKVELIEGDKSLFLKYKINQYYLLFKGNSISKEDFYEHLTILKDIAKKVLNNEDDEDENEGEEDEENNY